MIFQISNLQSHSTLYTCFSVPTGEVSTVVEIVEELISEVANNQNKSEFQSKIIQSTKLYGIPTNKMVKTTTISTSDVSSIDKVSRDQDNVVVPRNSMISLLDHDSKGVNTKKKKVSFGNHIVHVHRRALDGSGAVSITGKSLAIPHST